MKVYHRNFFEPIAILTICAISILCSGCVSTVEYPRDLQKTSEYLVQIDTNSTLQNATFLIPLPVKNNQPVVGDRKLSPDDFSKNGYSIDFPQKYPEWTMNESISYISLGPNYPHYIRLHADLWPKGKIEWDAHYDTDDLATPLLFFNTLSPIGNESVLLPKIDFSPPEYPLVLRRIPKYSDEYYTPEVTEESSLVYADYISPNATPPFVSIEIRADNYWRDMDDTGGSNYYTDEVEGNIENNHGWNVLSGELSVANGPYPDLSSPRWQKLIRNSS